ncbi:MAG: type I-E CRISPR-associated protein Cse2/CasB [Candidatus Omnitrophota bacterium]|nr:type I-E CRISPR-associated protein Cse2/CasB [Candidatus Omnitrophota bacterium]
MGELDFNLVWDWWEKLEKNRGGRAELRRAHTVTEVAFIEVYHRLYQQMEFSDKEALALVAGICAHVKANGAGKFAEQMAKGDKPDDKPKVSELRFRRLLAITDCDELYHAMVRIVRLLGGEVNVCDLAKTVYWWNENTKKQLAYDYYTNVQAE